MPALLRPLARRHIDDYESIRDTLLGRSLKPPIGRQAEDARIAEILVTLARTEAGLTVSCIIDGAVAATEFGVRAPAGLVSSYHQFVVGLQLPASGVITEPFAQLLAQRLQALGSEFGAVVYPGAVGRAVSDRLTRATAGVTVQISIECPMDLAGLPFEAASIDGQVVALDPVVQLARRVAGVLGASATIVASTFGRQVLDQTSDEPLAHLARLGKALDRAVRLEQRSQYGALAAVLPGIVVDAWHTLDGPSAAPQLAAHHLATSEMVQAFVLIKHDRQNAAVAAASSALSSARLSEDQVLVGAALRCLAEAQLRGGDHELACDLASEAAAHVGRAAIAGPEAMAVQGAAVLSAATSCARAGDRVGSTRLLVEAQRCADQLAMDFVGTVVFGPTNLAIHRVAFEVELGDPRAALRHSHELHPERGQGMEERRARYLIDVARAHVALRQDDLAVRALLARRSASHPRRSGPIDTRRPSSLRCSAGSGGEQSPTSDHWLPIPNDRAKHRQSRRQLVHH